VRPISAAFTNLQIGEWTFPILHVPVTTVTADATLQHFMISFH